MSLIICILLKFRSQSATTATATASDDPWPKFVNSVWLFKRKYLVNITEYIEGKYPDFSNAAHRDLCIKALEKLHSRGIAHRDVRPPNFLICPDETKAYVLDFGFSKKVKEDSHDIFKSEKNEICHPNNKR